jgi:Bacterial Ig-like domain
MDRSASTASDGNGNSSAGMPACGESPVGQVMTSAKSLALRASRTCVALALLITAACAGNGEGLDANGRPIAPGSGGSNPPLSADFDSIQANIFTPICSVCHAGASAPEGLHLDAGNSFNMLVGVPSTEVPSILRVKSGDPDNSYIIQKLEGHAAVGGQMPLGGPYLSTTTIAFIRQWITDGAQPSATAAAASATPFAITSIVPDSAEGASAPPPQIMVAFNHDLDVTQIASATARIERLPLDASAGATQAIPARITVSADNLKALMAWPAQPLGTGHYRVVIQAGPLGFKDTSGQSIAIENPNDGGSVISTFDVEVSP